MSVDLKDNCSMSDLLSLMCKRFSNKIFKEYKAVLMVNNKNALPETILKEGDVVLLLPIMGGG